ncbi:MAG TPA: glycosyltransferase family 1 protein [Candidatus Dormibacteraeota bacterium]|nr:glycosyltransferase family 1 protein [Candidatus Dormibacteraeota bacterium]
MEIGIDASRAFQAEPTGIGIYATEVISRLLASPPGQLRVYLNRRSPPENALELPPGSEWRCLPFPRGWTAFRLRRELQRQAPTLLWIPAYRLPPGRVPRSIVTVHGVEHRFAPLAYPGRQADAVESFVLDTLQRAARVISPSETTKADLVHLYRADPNRISVIPHGISAELRPIAPNRIQPLLRQLGVQPPYFLVVGAHHPRKNVPFLIEQFARAFPGSQSSEIRLVVTNAPGELGQALRTRAASLGLSDRLTSLGHVAGEMLAALYSGSVAACVPSLYEGFGLPALEAMACGAPVLATNAGGVQEIAEGAALLVPVGDAQGWVEGLRRLYQEPGLREHLQALGLARASRYSWDRSAQAHARLLASELQLATAAKPPA